MSETSSAVLTAFRGATPVLAALPCEVNVFDALDDADVLDVQREIAAQRRLLDARAAVVAGQVARRSAPELGSAGLAQRGGFRTPEELTRVTTGSTAGDARSIVRVGVLMHETAAGGRIDQNTGEHFPPTRLWLAAASHAVAAGELSVAAAEAIRSGMGEATESITPIMLTDAVLTLLREARVLDADRLFARARALRDELDAAGIADREQERRDARSLKLFKKADGMGRLVWDMDPETLIQVSETYDQLTSPRRGGPRFVCAEASAEGSPEQRRITSITDDSRTTEQIASDGFLQLLSIAGDTAPTALIGLRRPAVRVLVTASDLRDRDRDRNRDRDRDRDRNGDRDTDSETHASVDGRDGHGRMEGCRTPVSIETVERIACTQGIVEITFSTDGQPLDVGREQRLFTRRQRIALAARDGGCRWPGCERPPSWTEAHHTKHWQRDDGRTDVADGILLCRHHHLLLHNNHWEITRDRATYWLIPPSDIDHEQKPILMPTHSLVMRDIEAQHGRARELALVR